MADERLSPFLLNLDDSSGVRVYLRSREGFEHRPGAADGLPAHRFREQTTYEVVIEGTGAGELKAWMGEFVFPGGPEQREPSLDIHVQGARILTFALPFFG